MFSSDRFGPPVVCYLPLTLRARDQLPSSVQSEAIPVHIFSCLVSCLARKGTLHLPIAFVNPTFELRQPQLTEKA